jgi:hypothetical protein
MQDNSVESGLRLSAIRGARASSLCPFVQSSVALLQSAISTKLKASVAMSGFFFITGFVFDIWAADMSGQGCSDPQNRVAWRI